MANWQILKAAIANIIKENGNQDIKGQLLQSVLTNIVSSVGENATFAGIAIPTTNPGMPDGNVFYIAYTSGAYSNFSGIKIEVNEVVLLTWDGAWHKEKIGLATEEAISIVYQALKKDVKNINLLIDSKILDIKTVLSQEITEKNSELKEELSTKDKILDSRLVAVETGKQDKLIPGNNININDTTKVISTDITVLQSTGNDKKNPVSQDALTKELLKRDEKIESQKAELEAAAQEAIDDINSKSQEALDKFSTQKVTPDMLSESTIQLIKTSGGGTVTNLADDEDIESVNSGEDKVLKLKDRKYVQDSFNGQGYKILRKGTSIRDQIIEENTIYEIRYDFNISESSETGYIDFDDEEIKRICVENFSSDGIGVTKEDAEKVTSLSGLFNGNQLISTFHELKYFTGLTTLAAYQFSSMSSNFKAISLPETIKSIANYAFRSNTHIAFDILFYSKVPPALSWASFNGCDKATFYVPDESLELYKTADTWSNYASRIYPLSEHNEGSSTEEIKTLNIPGGCTLYFNGGSIYNGHLNCNNAIIKAAQYKIFGENMSFKGKFKNDVGHTEWFGAESTTEYGIYSSGDTMSISPIVDSLPDASEPINTALQRFSTVSLAGNRTYKINSTINIPSEKTLEIPKTTILVPYLHGNGLIVKEVDKETSTFLDDKTLENPAEVLTENQFIATSSMEAAISLSASANIQGGGTLFLGKSSYAIGILLKGWGYSYLDMTFAPHINLRIIGGSKATCYAPDVRDIIGSTAPEDSTGEDGQYYYDKETYSYYHKENGAWAQKSPSYNPRNQFNTSIRIDVPNGTRVINPYMEVWDMYGFRGLEIVTYGDGWFNESILKGTISNKHGGFISIFAGGGGVSIHHWQDITMQVDKIMQHDCRIFFASKCNVIEVGMVWDLAWFAPPRVETAFELCNKAGNVDLSGSVDSINYVKDNGSNNVYVKHPKYTNESSIIPMMFDNLLDGVSPSFKSILTTPTAQWCCKFNEIKTLEELIGVSKTEGFGISPSNYLFDGDNTTYERVIDTNNELFGYAFNINADNKNSQIKSVRNQCWIEIDYKPSTNIGKTCFVAVAGYNIETVVQPLLAHSITGTWSNPMTYKTFIRIKGGPTRQAPCLYFYCLENTADITVDIVAIKLITDGSATTFKRRSNAGSESNRPNCLPNGATYFNTDKNILEVNKGDAVNPYWSGVSEDKMTKFSEISVSSANPVIRLNSSEIHKCGVVNSIVVITDRSSDIFGFIEFTTNAAGTTKVTYANFIKYEDIELKASTTYIIQVQGDVATITELVHKEAPIGAITFEDSYCEYLCAKRWGEDGFITLLQASEVNTLTSFTKEPITAFNELEYFTGITAIPEYCFQDCGSLQKVTFPESIITIGNHVFRWAYSVKTFICRAVIPPELGSSQQAMTATIYVPDESVEAYKAANVWSNYANKIKGISEITE